MAMQMQYSKNLDLPWVCEKIHSKRETVEKRTMDITLQQRELKWIFWIRWNTRESSSRKRTPKPER
jgi:hypothetical protein